jgi:hypothetical protein
MVADLSKVPTAVLLESLKLRSERDPLAFFRPASEEQSEALRCGARGMLVLGGNRSGKTQIGAVRAVAKGTGREVLGQPFRKARRIWCISQELPSQRDKPHTQVEAIQRWMPTEALRGGSWSSAYSPGSFVLTLADGTKYEFKSYDQDLLAFESAAVDHIWFDEEPTRRQIFTSCMLRLVDRRGTWDMTLTPVLSLEGKGWVEELWEARHEAQGHYECLVLPTTGNRYLPQDEVERTAAGLAEEEKQVRLYGAFARLGGRVLSEFDGSVHLCEDFCPPREWRHYLLIDPGWNTAAVLFVAVDPDGHLWLYNELYQHERRPDQIFPMIVGMRAISGNPDYRCLIDPAGIPPKRTSTGHEAPSDVDEYLAAAQKAGADWFRPAGADNGDPYAWRVKRYLQQRRLHVCKQLRWWRWEQERWTRQKERQGPAAMERAVPDAPIDRYNHLMDLTRYMCNELPLPEDIPLPEPTMLERHWQRLPGAEPKREIV